MPTLPQHRKLKPRKSSMSPELQNTRSSATGPEFLWDSQLSWAGAEQSTVPKSTLPALFSTRAVRLPPPSKHSCRQLPSEAGREDRAGASPGTTWQLLWRGASPPDEMEDEAGLMTVWHSAARGLPTPSPPLPHLGRAGALGHHPAHPGAACR